MPLIPHKFRYFCSVFTSLTSVAIQVLNVKANEEFLNCCFSFWHDHNVHIYSPVMLSVKQCICTFSRHTGKQTQFTENNSAYGASQRFFEDRTLPQAEIEMLQLFPIRQLCFSGSRSRDVKIAHVEAYRSRALMGLAACLENLWSKTPLLRMTLLDFTSSPV